MKNIDFEITYVATEAIGMKLPVVEIEGLLNKSIQLKDYGAGVQKIFFVFLAVPEEGDFHQPHITYTEAERHLELAFRLPYEQTLNSNEDECMLLLHSTFLKAVKLCRESKVGSFAWEAFAISLSKILSTN